MIGERLKALRGGAGLTQERLARAADLSNATVYLIERGGKDPSWSTVVKLARALGVSVASFDDAPTPTTPEAPPAKGRKPRKAKTS